MFTDRLFWFVVVGSILGGILWQLFVRLVEQVSGGRQEWLH